MILTAVAISLAVIGGLIFYLWENGLSSRECLIAIFMLFVGIAIGATGQSENWGRVQKEERLFKLR